MPIRTFPEACLYSFDEVIQDTFLCDTSQDWEN
nr:MULTISPECIES: hypothetical protein [unclassified Moorena]